MKKQIKWVTFSKRTNEPKLSYLRYRLNEMGIKNVRHGQSCHAPIIEIPAEDEAKANELLSEKWGKKTFGHNPRGKTMLDDVEDDDPRFEHWEFLLGIEMLKDELDEKDEL